MLSFLAPNMSFTKFSVDWRFSGISTSPSLFFEEYYHQYLKPIWQNLFRSINPHVSEYIPPPTGFNCDIKSKKCLQLHRALYGLLQSPKAWAETFRKVLLKYHLNETNFDYSIYVKFENNAFVVVLVYVDDIMIISSSDTIPDVSFATNRIAKYAANPKLNYSSELTRIIFYLKYRPDVKLKYIKRSNDLKLECLSDASFTPCNTNLISITGMACYLNNDLFYWPTISSKAVDIDFIYLQESLKKIEVIHVSFEEMLADSLTNLFIRKINGCVYWQMESVG
uniref:Reverse transcriptase Ty1/copia-type domain-containing protein n=1 Tax=Strongyloides venezuelensis TaxID=75913 RepID=A0A0K0FC95_STRVS